MSDTNPVNTVSKPKRIRTPVKKNLPEDIQGSDMFNLVLKKTYDIFAGDLFNSLKPEVRVRRVYDLVIPSSTEEAQSFKLSYYDELDCRLLLSMRPNVEDVEVISQSAYHTSTVIDPNTYATNAMFLFTEAAVRTEINEMLVRIIKNMSKIEQINALLLTEAATENPQDAIRQHHKAITILTKKIIRRITGVDGGIVTLIKATDVQQACIQLADHITDVTPMNIQSLVESAIADNVEFRAIR